MNFFAPFSYFNVACSNPPTLLFCPNRRADGSKKDTLLNIEATGEFVIHIVDERTVEAMNATSAAGGDIVIGRVVLVHIRDDVRPDIYIDLKALRPVARLAGNSYTRVTETFDLPRPVLKSMEQ